MSVSFLEELKRRNVLRAVAAYLAVSWLLIQVVETVFPAFGFGGTDVRMVIIVLVIGLIPVLIFSWAFELTPEGLKKEWEVDRSQSITARTSKTLDRIIMAVLALALGFFAFDKFVLDPARDATREESVARQARSEALVESYGDKSIAVLPFVNMSSDPEQEYFSDGISEELLNLLTRIPQLRVISRSSAFSYKGKDIDIPTMAAQLNVSHILEGSVRKAGNRVRITAQLIEARTDTHLWSATYDRTLDDIFATQDEIAASVVEQLKLTLLGDEALSVRKTDPEAYALFLQARHIRLQDNPQAYEKALQLYQQALAIDPDYPPALEGLAEMYVFQGLVGMLPVDEASRHAREAIDRALAIDPQFAVGVAGLGWIAVLYDHDMPAAARHFERAMMLDPTDLDIISGVAYLAESLGRLDIAIAFKEYAVARDPAGPVGHFELALAYLKVGRMDDAAASVRIALTLHPEHMGAWQLLGLALLAKGKTRAALKAMEQEAIEMYRLSGLAIAYHDLGQKNESDKFLAELIEEHAEDGSAEVASVFAWRGDNDDAFAWLEKARENNETSFANVASHYTFRTLHDDPRWQPFLAKMGQSDAQLAAIEFNVKLPEQRPMY
ncbi:MAG: tetratricopeptide repeat protein [Gammaproteobacteria bacterium]|nr:MAG: tetratricopeptide repeat protein [Gammaproteobacteria bacterium]